MLRRLEKRGSSTTGLIVGVAVAFAVATLGAAAGLFWFWRRFRRRDSNGGHSKEFVRPDYSYGSPSPLLDHDLAPHPLPPPPRRRPGGGRRSRPVSGVRPPPDLPRISEERASMDPRASVERFGHGAGTGVPTPRVVATAPTDEGHATTVYHPHVDDGRMSERFTDPAEDTQREGHAEVLQV